MLDASDSTPVAIQQADSTTDADGLVGVRSTSGWVYAFEYAYRGGGTINVARSFTDGRRHAR